MRRPPVQGAKAEQQFLFAPPDDPQLRPPLAKGAPVLVHCKAGDMVLWDSRVLHCNTAAAGGDSTASTGTEATVEVDGSSRAGEEGLLQRLSALVCGFYTPVPSQ
jgi:hypothetical protein